MKRVAAVFRALLISTFRSPLGIFFTLFFPVMLLLILSSIFSNIGTSISVKVALVNESATFKNTNMDFASYISDAFKGMATATDGKIPILSLKSGSTEGFLNSSIEKLKNGSIDAVVVIPKLFNTNLYGNLLQTGGLNFLKPQNADIEIYTKQNSQSSGIAYSILSSVIGSFNREFLKRTGENMGKYVEPKSEYVTSGDQTDFSYINFLLAGIIVMAFMTVSLFGVTDDLLVQREKKVLRRLFVAPLDRGDYFWGMTTSNLVLEVIQLTLLLTVGYWLGARIRFDSMTVFYLFLTIITTLPLGFFVASFAKSANSGNSMANIFNFIFMFLGGLYFPLTGVPFAIQAVSYSIPTTYLANGLRDSMGIMPSPTPLYLNILVPSIWGIVMAVYSSRKFKWEV